MILMGVLLKHCTWGRGQVLTLLTGWRWQYITKKNNKQIFCSVCPHNLGDNHGVWRGWDCGELCVYFRTLKVTKT